MSSRFATQLGAIFRDAMIPVNGRASNLVSGVIEVLLMNIETMNSDRINFPSRQPRHSAPPSYPCKPDERLILPRFPSPLSAVVDRKG